MYQLHFNVIIERIKLLFGIGSIYDVLPVDKYNGRYGWSTITS